MKTKEAIEFDDIDAQKFLYYMAKDDPKNKEKYNAVSKLILLLLNEKSQREKCGEKLESIVNHNKIRNKVLEARIKGLKEILKKFEKMWEAFKGRFGNGTIENNFGGRLGPIDDIMDNFKKKYFPKED